MTIFFVAQYEDEEIRKGYEEESKNEEESGNKSGNDQENESEEGQPETNAIHYDDATGDNQESNNDEPRRTVRRNSEIVSDIIMGNLEIEVPSQVRLVRIFTSSTFTGTLSLAFRLESIINIYITVNKKV